MKKFNIGIETTTILTLIYILFLYGRVHWTVLKHSIFWNKCWRYVRSYYEFKTVCLFKVCA